MTCIWYISCRVAEEQIDALVSKYCRYIELKLLYNPQIHDYFIYGIVAPFLNIFANVITNLSPSSMFPDFLASCWLTPRSITIPFNRHSGPWLPSLIAWFVFHPTDTSTQASCQHKNSLPQQRAGSCRHKRDTNFTQLNLGSVTNFLKQYCGLISPTSMNSSLSIPLFKWQSIAAYISSVMLWWYNVKFKVKWRWRHSLIIAIPTSLLFHNLFSLFLLLPLYFIFLANKLSLFLEAAGFGYVYRQS